MQKTSCDKIKVPLKRKTNNKKQNRKTNKKKTKQNKQTKIR